MEKSRRARGEAQERRERIVLEPEGDLTEEARKIYNGLNGIRACDLVLRTVKIVGGKIVITRVAAWRPPVVRHDDEPSA